eukprot:2299142-Alexandrium_andersonii.AAC.1
MIEARVLHSWLRGALRRARSQHVSIDIQVAEQTGPRSALAQHCQGWADTEGQAVWVIAGSALLSDSHVR